MCNLTQAVRSDVTEVPYKAADGSAKTATVSDVTRFHGFKEASAPSEADVRRCCCSPCAVCDVF